MHLRCHAPWNNNFGNSKTMAGNNFGDCKIVKFYFVVVNPQNNFDRIMAINLILSRTPPLGSLGIYPRDPLGNKTRARANQPCNNKISNWKRKMIQDRKKMKCTVHLSDLEQKKFNFFMQTAIQSVTTLASTTSGSRAVKLPPRRTNWYDKIFCWPGSATYNIFVFALTATDLGSTSSNSVPKRKEELPMWPLALTGKYSTVRAVGCDT